MKAVATTRSSPPSRFTRTTSPPFSPKRAVSLPPARLIPSRLSKSSAMQRDLCSLLGGLRGVTLSEAADTTLLSGLPFHSITRGQSRERVLACVCNYFRRDIFDLSPGLSRQATRNLHTLVAFPISYISFIHSCRLSIVGVATE